MEEVGQSSKDQWQISKSRGKWKEISHKVKELGMVVTEKKKHLGQKLHSEYQERETEIFKIMGCLADDAKEGSDERNRIKNNDAIS